LNNEIILYLSFYEGSKREVSEDIGEVLPGEFIAVLAEAFVVEAIDFVDFPVLVVA
jgi:hypothetical protein